MCFSAQASFISGTILLCAGLYSIKRTNAASYMAFASIPVLFGIQQISEGFVWLGLSGSAIAQHGKLWIYIFLFFSQIMRPTRAPFAVYLSESDRRRKKIILGLGIIGLLISAYMAYCLYEFGASASIVNHHINYLFSLPHVSSMTIGTLYVGATVGSIVASSNRLIQTWGSLLLISVAITFIYYEYFFVSVWCFFAAILSTYVFHIINTINKKSEAIK